MNATIHIGLPDAATAPLQSILARTPGINHLSGGSDNAELNQLNDVITRPEGWLPTSVRDTFQAGMAAKPGPAVASIPNLTTWRATHPAEYGRRLKQVFGKPRLIAVMRRPLDWAYEHYFSRLERLQLDTFAGPNPWIEKHLSQLKVRSELAQVRFTQTVTSIAERAGAEEILIIPAEMLLSDRAGFLASVDSFIGAEGRLAAAGADPNDDPASRYPLEYYNAFRTLSFFKRDRKRFDEYMAMFYERVGPMLRKRYKALMEEPETTLGQWVEWMFLVQFAMRKWLAAEKLEMFDFLPKFEDYAIRDGLAAYLGEIEAEETELIQKSFGLDLKPFGYAPPPPPQA